MTDTPPTIALVHARLAGAKSPCQKSKRGVVIWKDLAVIASGYNHQPQGFECDGSAQCKSSCNKFCVHAETDALMQAGNLSEGAEMLHLEWKDGKFPISSGPPSCWQCSRHVVDRKITKMWLFENDGWKVYTAKEFHKITLKNCGLWNR